MNFNFTLVKILIFSIALALSVHKIIKGIKTKNVKIIDIIAMMIFSTILYLNVKDWDFSWNSSNKNILIN